MKALGIITVAAIVALIVWAMFGRQGDLPPDPVAEVEAPVAPDPEETVEVEPAPEPVDETVDQAGEDAGDAVQELQNDAAQAVESAEQQVNDAVQDAVENANEAVRNAGDAVNGAVAEALGENETPTEATSELGEALTVEGFDAATLREAVDNSDLDEAQTQLANGLIAQAEENPVLIQSVVDQLRDLLGPE